MRHPKISCILPVYNGEQYLKEAITSILEQSYDDFEFIIVNDGSTDLSEEIIQRFANKDHRIRYFKKTNSGLISSLNYALEKCKGEYIARMDADDISFPSRFKLQSDFLDSNPKTCAVGSAVTEAKIINPFQVKRYSGRKQCRFGLLFFNCLGHPSVMIRRSHLTKLNLRYDEGYPLAEDYKLWCELNKHYDIDNLNKILLYYRRHPNQVSTKEHRTQVNSHLKIIREQFSYWFNIQLDIPARQDDYDTKTLMTIVDAVALADRKISTSEDSLLLHQAAMEFLVKGKLKVFMYYLCQNPTKKLLSNPRIFLRFFYRTVKWQLFK